MKEHYLYSLYREKLIEHLIVSELLKLAWRNKDFTLEISRPEVDNSGYDLIVEANGIIRHIQLKAAFVGSATALQKIHTALAKKPSGCVVLVYFNNETLELGPYHFFGAAPGLPLPSLENLKIAKHTKGNASGMKADRLNIRVLNKGQFEKLNTINDLYGKLFGSSS
ncbi:hypothetical protein ACX3X6_05145 [Pseudomonas sichuanensis]